VAVNVDGAAGTAVFGTSDPPLQSDPGLIAGANSTATQLSDLGVDIPRTLRRGHCFWTTPGHLRPSLVSEKSRSPRPPVAVRRGLPVRPVADQLLVRTGEMARGHRVGMTLRGNVGAMALYLPALSGMRLL
jgi:hypothetical protein